MKNTFKNKIRKGVSGSKIKKNDQVLVITGKDKGKKGKVLKVVKKIRKALVEGINLKKKRVKPKTSDKKGQTIETVFPIDLSNIKFICPKCQKGAKIGIKIEKGKKERICKKCKQSI